MAGIPALTQALSASLSINPMRAEELKRERGVAGTGGVAAGSPAASVARASRLKAAVIAVVCLAGMGSDVGNTMGTGSVPMRRPVAGSTG